MHVYPRNPECSIADRNSERCSHQNIDFSVAAAFYEVEIQVQVPRRLVDSALNPDLVLTNVILCQNFYLYPDITET